MGIQSGVKQPHPESISKGRGGAAYWELVGGLAYVAARGSGSASQGSRSSDFLDAYTGRRAK
jgi:hypothetical protein